MPPRPITPKQQAILHFLYLYRYLTRLQLQTLLGHKSKHRLSVWLKDLREKQYIGWIYSPGQFSDRSKPATYFLMSSGIHHLSNVGGYPLSELRLRYRDARRSTQFVTTHTLVADCAIRLLSLDRALKSDHSASYTVLTRAALATQLPMLHNIIEDAGLRPQLIVLKQHGAERTTYFFEMLAAAMPRRAIRCKLQEYVQCLNDTDSLLESPGLTGVLLVLSNRAGLLAAKRVARSMVGNDHHALLLFALAADVEQHGINAAIWEEL